MNYDALRQLRINRNITLQEMADALGLKTAGGYLRIETGENNLKAEHLPVISKKFNLPLNVLMAILFENQFDESSTFNDKHATSA